MYAKCLAPDIEYKTVNVPEIISSRELVLLLLSKYRKTFRAVNSFKKAAPVKLWIGKTTVSKIVD